jgi:hypothetical protein
MLQRAVDRLDSVFPPERILIVTREEYLAAAQKTGSNDSSTAICPRVEGPFRGFFHPIGVYPTWEPVREI